MEKQPIDNLFAQKLSDLEIEPRDTAFTLLKARQRERKLPVYWGYWASAACLVLVGTFSWWIMEPAASVPSNRLTAIKTERPGNKLLGRARGEVLIDRMQGQPESAANTSMNKSKETKMNVVSRQFNPKIQQLKMNRQLVTSVQQKVQVANKNDSIRVISNAETTPLPANEPSRDNRPQISERTLIVTIEALSPASQPTLTGMSVAEEGVAPRRGLNVWLSSIKRLKKGEDLALSPTKVQHHSFGKLYDGVKESIKNNSID